MYKARLSLKRREVLARERRQTEES